LYWHFCDTLWELDVHVPANGDGGGAPASRNQHPGSCSHVVASSWAHGVVLPEQTPDQVHPGICEQSLKLLTLQALLGEPEQTTGVGGVDPDDPVDASAGGWYGGGWYGGG
jgi:hypothetical protein